ncbi:MAG: substrate-binding domain-containing protein [Flavobacteriaceae bacterium]
MPQKKYTIKDVAKMAGVSKGTVDRVLHKRGKVSEKAQKKVEAILKEIDFHPNPVARNLKSNKTYHIAVLLPSEKIDPFWIPAHKGISMVKKEFRGFGLTISTYTYTDSSSFQACGKAVMDNPPDAIFMAPLFNKIALELICHCENQHILVGLFNNYLTTEENTLFVGQNLAQSGRVAGNLVDITLNTPVNLGVVHFNREPHMSVKETGLKTYLEEKGITTDITSIDIDTYDNPNYTTEIDNFVTSSNWDVIFVTNSKTYLMAESKKRLQKDFLLVGYDLLEKNIAFLKTGVIDFLIHQKPERQVVLGLNHLAEHLLFKKELPSKVLLPIDIISAENYRYHV